LRSQTATLQAAGCINPGSDPQELRQIDVQQGCRQLEQRESAAEDKLGRWILIQQSRPPRFKPRQSSTANSSGQQLTSGCLQPWLTRDLASIEFFETLAPPCKLDRTERRLRGASNHIRHRVFKIEQCIERGPQMHRPVEPDEIAIPEFSDR